MEQRLLLILMSCGVYCVIGTLNPYKPIYVNQLKTFDEAQQYCRDNHHDLLTLWNQAEIDEIFAQEDFTALFAWIGLKRTSQIESNQWHWALADPEFYKEGETEYRNWASGEPQNDIGEYCSVMDDKGYFIDMVFWNAFFFICYNGQNNASSKYILVSEQKTCREARSHCREFYTDLVSVRNQDENLLIQQLIPPNEKAYIGLLRDPFFWSDNSPSPFRTWATGEPYGPDECVVQQLQNSRKWDNQLCSIQYPFFCQTVPKIGVLTPVLRLEVKSDESVNLNDPVMKAIILQVIQQKLISQGMSEQENLEWRQKPNGDVFQRTQEKAGASVPPPRAVCP